MGKLLRVVQRRAAGSVLITDPGAGNIESDTLQCVHCQSHWATIYGSQRTRGWCMNCGGPTCGSAGCDVCVPWEKQMEAIEAAARRLLP